MKPTEPAQPPSAFPVYDTPQTIPVTPAKGPPHADSKQSGVLAKRISKMMTPKMKPRIKGIQSDQSVHVGHKKKNHPNPIPYY